jgi:hypothetical protein
MTFVCGFDKRPHGLLIGEPVNVLDLHRTEAAGPPARFAVQVRTGSVSSAPG